MSRTTRIEVVLDATPARVYRALTRASDVERWMVPDGMTSEVHSFEAREGGVFRISLNYESPSHLGNETGWRMSLTKLARLVEEEPA